MKHSGALITFEGLDGCGKTTQLRLTAERLRSQGRIVVATKEPGGTAVGQQIREIVLSSAIGTLSRATELALMFAARAQHLEEVICPALRAGKIILCDRFTDSTTAYQGYGRGIALEDIQTLDCMLCHGMRPDLTLYLDIDPECATERTISRNRTTHQPDTRFEEEGLEFFRQVRNGYLDVAQREPERFRVLDGRGSINDVQDLVSRNIEEFLKRAHEP